MSILTGSTENGLQCVHVQTFLCSLTLFFDEQVHRHRGGTHKRAQTGASAQGGQVRKYASEQADKRTRAQVHRRDGNISST